MIMAGVAVVRPTESAPVPAMELVRLLSPQQDRLAQVVLNARPRRRDFCHRSKRLSQSYLFRQHHLLISQEFLLIPIAYHNRECWHFSEYIQARVVDGIHCHANRHYQKRHLSTKITERYSPFLGRNKASNSYEEA